MTVGPAVVVRSAVCIVDFCDVSRLDTSNGASGKGTLGAAAIMGAAAGVDDLVDPVESGMTAASPMAAAVTAPTATVEATFWVQSAPAACSSLWARLIK